MSVLKSIFHRYNKTAKDYDTLHPETEHAQVTDFGQGVIAHLASNVLASTISSITSDSLMAKLVKLVFNATGVQYNIAQNGYVKFGDLFGGLIIQWTSTDAPAGSASTATLPIAYTQWYKIVATGVVSSVDSDFKQTVAILKDYNMSLSGFALRSSGADRPAAHCITIGI